ncbi:hypothetical protein [Streptomyces sp. NPDC057381]|uniref:hypothetical protein n=1 Tax=unclassified Streptomyces TaxID=2593676 RepID=UPI0036316B10
MESAGDDFAYWVHNWIPVIQEFDAEYGLFFDASEGGAACLLYGYAEGGVVEVGHTVPSLSRHNSSPLPAPANSTADQEFDVQQ